MYPHRYDPKIIIRSLLLIVVCSLALFINGCSSHNASISKSPTEQTLVFNSQSPVYIKYCAQDVNVNLNADAKNKIGENLSNTSIETLKDNLLNSRYDNSEVPQALYYLGFKLMIDEGQVDEGISFYECAAAKYYDRFAMYRMMRFYYSGTESIKKQVPNAIINNNIQPDYPKAYFWATAIVYMELGEKTGFTDPGTMTGWNTIATLDDLQNTGKLTGSEMKTIESQVKLFIGKKYPSVQ